MSWYHQTKWIRGDIVFRQFAENSNLEFSKSISSNKLRNKFASVMQISNLSKEESEQFAPIYGAY